MSVWRRKAIEAIPEAKAIIEEAESPIVLWIQLHELFLVVVKKGDSNKIGKILMYASWCGSERSGRLPNETSTAVYCAFYEDIGRNKDLWKYFNAWFFPSEYKALRGAFRYGLTELEIVDLDSIYYQSTGKTNFAIK